MNSAISYHFKVLNRRNPRAVILDYKTNAVPMLIKSSTTRLTLGFFELSGEPMKLGHFRQIGFTLQRIGSHCNREPFLVASEASVDFKNCITNADFLDGKGNITFQVRPSQIEDSEAGEDYRLLIFGVTDCGSNIVFGVIPCVIEENVLSEIAMLDSAIVPLNVPRGTGWEVRQNQQALYALPIVTDGTIFINGALVEVPGTPNANLQTVNT